MAGSTIDDRHMPSANPSVVLRKLRTFLIALSPVRYCRVVEKEKRPYFAGDGSGRAWKS
jgi:hypothetical protein